MKSLLGKNKRSLPLFSLPLNMRKINIPRHMLRINWFLIIIAVVGGLLTTNPVSAEEKLKCFEKIGGIKLGWDPEDQGLIVLKPGGKRVAVCRYPFDFSGDSVRAYASVLAQWCEELPCDNPTSYSQEFENDIQSPHKHALVSEKVTEDTHPHFIAAARDFQKLKLDLLAQAESRAIPKGDEEGECEKGWEMREQGCVSCEDICGEKDHFVYDSDKSSTNSCECKCEDGYEPGYDDLDQKICKKAACPANSTNVADLPDSSLLSNNRKLNRNCYCDEGYKKSFDDCVVEGPPGDELTYISPSYSVILAGEKIQFSLKKKTQGRYDITTISNDLIVWKTVDCKSRGSAGQMVGDLNEDGVFTGKTIGTCNVVGIMDRTPYKTEVTVKCSENVPGNLNKILRLFKARIPIGIILSDPNDPKHLLDKTTPGRANNIYSNTDDRYNPFRCGAYQGQVLDFLHDIQSNPDECTLLNNYDFGPIEGSCGLHHAVVIYPKGTDWKKEGTVLDPWPTQTPEWCHITTWFKNFRPIAGETYISGQAYPTQSSDANTISDYCNRADDAMLDAMDDPVGSIRSGAGTTGQFIRDTIGGIVPCPVDLQIIDSEGRRLGVLADGSMAHEIPHSFIANIHKGETENSWYFELNSTTTNQYNLKLTGISDGIFELLWVSRKDKNIRYYGKQSIKKGELVKVSINPESPDAPLILPNGSEIQPTLLGSINPDNDVIQEPERHKYPDQKEWESLGGSDSVIPSRQSPDQPLHDSGRLTRPGQAHQKGGWEAIEPERKDFEPGSSKERDSLGF